MPLPQAPQRAPEGPWGERRPIWSTPTSEAARGAIERVQRVLGGRPSGDLDDQTKQLIRGFQAQMGLMPTGIIDKTLADTIDLVFPHGAIEDGAH